MKVGSINPLMGCRKLPGPSQLREFCCLLFHESNCKNNIPSTKAAPGRLNSCRSLEITL